MRSRTSFFNKALFLKTVKRFWPVWFFYFAVWFIAMPLTLNSYGYDAFNRGTSIIRQIMYMGRDAGPVISLIFACFAVMAVWSFLYNFRSMSGTVSLPIKRETLFITLSLAGLLPLLGVNVLILICSAIVELLHGAIHITALMSWLGMVSLQLICFYGIASFCAQLTGNIIVLPCVYAVLNFTAYVVESLVRVTCDNFIFGLEMNGNYTFTFLSPVIQMLEETRVSSLKTFLSDGSYTVYGYYLEGWEVLAAYAIVGLVLCVCALLLYRARRMETAGDVVAVNVLKPIFKYCMTFGCALVIGYLLFASCGMYDSMDGQQTEHLLYMFAFMAFGAVVGYFSAEMLMHKSFRVFKGRWLGCGASLVIVALFLGCVEFDVLGIERNMPDSGEIDYVRISTGDVVCLSESESVAAVLSLHESIISNKNSHEAGYVSYEDGHRIQYLDIEYYMKDGGKFDRTYYLSYNINQPETYGDTLTLQSLINNDEAIAYRKKTTFDFTRDTITYGSVSGMVKLEDEDTVKVSGARMDIYDDYEMYGQLGIYAIWEFSPEEAYELWTRCIIPDMEDGTLGRIWLIANDEYKNTVYSAELNIDAKVRNDEYDARKDPYSYTVTGESAVTSMESVIGYVHDSFYTVPTVDSWRTNAWLKEHGVVMYTIAEHNVMDAEIQMKYAQ